MSQAHKFALFAAALILAVAGAADAQRLQIFPSAPGSFYLGGEGGWTQLSEAHAMATIPVIGHRSDPQTWADGENFGIRGGYEWGPWRAEEEFRYQRNDDRFLETSGGRGRYTAAALMANLIYDPFPNWRVSPHIGGGIGPVDLSSTLRVNGLGQVITGDDWVFGYQGIAGVRFRLASFLNLDVDYRYLATTTPHFRTGQDFVDGGVHAPGISVASAYQSQSVVASISLLLGAAPSPVVAAAAPPMVPPPVRRKVFLVFFAWDKDTLTPEGMQIVHQAAAAWQAGAPVTIEVTGYTDRSGSAGYNQRLSERRANNVAVALTRFGVPRQRMAIGGRGDNDNRVPTPPGVREPQNRRVEIVFA